MLVLLRAYFMMSYDNNLIKLASLEYGLMLNLVYMSD